MLLGMRLVVTSMLVGVTLLFLPGIHATSCTCETCSKSLNVSALGSTWITRTCTFGKAYVTSVKAKSTDGSAFVINTMTSPDSDRFYTGAGSENDAVTCIQSGSIRTGGESSSLTIKIDCHNLMSKCPILYDIGIDCETSSATTIILLAVLYSCIYMLFMKPSLQCILVCCCVLYAVRQNIL